MNRYVKSLNKVSTISILLTILFLILIPNLGLFEDGIIGIGIRVFLGLLSFLIIWMLLKNDGNRLKIYLWRFYIKVSNAGAKRCYPEYLQRKIKISNVVIIYLISAAGIPFIIISVLFFMPALWVPAVSVLLGVLSILFNKAGWVHLGRFLASFAPVVAATLYNAYLSTAGEMPVVSMSLLSLSFSLVPFLIFDLRERSFLILSFLILAVMLMMSDYLNIWFEVELDAEIIKSGYLSAVVSLMALLSCTGSFLVLAYQNLSSELKAEKLLLESKESSEALQKQQKLIQEKNMQLLMSEKELRYNMKVLQDTQETLSKQKQVLEVEYKKTQEGLQYAKKIQFSILPNDAQLMSIIPESFVLYIPKDIVSGDFYWVSKNKEKLVVSVVDCTGHGVPGALVSLIGNNLLNEAINELQLMDPAKILEYLDKRVSAKLKHEEGIIRDGMDLGICVFETLDQSSVRLVYGGAKNTLYVVKNGELLTIKGDRKSIGGVKENFMFNQHEIILQKGDSFYLTTDGFIDQASPSRKRFGSGQLKSLIEEVHHIKIAEQKLIFEQALKDHQQDTEQRDDIILIGIRV